MTTAELHDVRLKRLRMRASRRGTKEMDLILMRFVDAALPSMPAEELDRFERLLDENDQDLYAWVAGQQSPAPAHADLIRRIQDVLPKVGQN